MAEQPQTKPRTKYTDRIEISETFVDQVEAAALSDGCMRMTLSTTRWPTTEQTESGLMGERITAARLVMPVKTAIEMYNSLAKLMSQLEQHGVIKGTKQTAPSAR